MDYEILKQLFASTDPAYICRLGKELKMKIPGFRSISNAPKQLVINSLLANKKKLTDYINSRMEPVEKKFTGKSMEEIEKIILESKRLSDEFMQIAYLAGSNDEQYKELARKILNEIEKDGEEENAESETTSDKKTETGKETNTETETDADKDPNVKSEGNKVTLNLEIKLKKQSDEIVRIKNELNELKTQHKVVQATLKKVEGERDRLSIKKYEDSRRYTEELRTMKEERDTWKEAYDSLMESTSIQIDELNSMILSLKDRIANAVSVEPEADECETATDNNDNTGMEYKNILILGELSQNDTYLLINKKNKYTAVSAKDFADMSDESAVSKYDELWYMEYQLPLSTQRRLNRIGIKQKQITSFDDLKLKLRRENA